MNIKTDNSAVIAVLNKRTENLQRNNAGLANESYSQQIRIEELQKERNELKVKNAALYNQLHELYHAMELISKIATVVPRDTAILEVINCYRTGELLEAHNLEQQAKGAINLTGVALNKINFPDCSKTRFEYFKAGVRELALAVCKEAKALKDKG